MGYRASAANSSSTGTTAVAVPGSAVAGDLLLVSFFWPGSATAPGLTTSAGTAYTTLIAPTATSTANLAVYSRVATAGDLGSTVTLTTGNTTRIAAMVWVESNAASVDAATSLLSATGTTINIPSATPTGGHTSDRQIVFYGGEDTGSGVTNSITTPTGGFTAREFIRSTHASLKNVNLGACGRQLNSAAATNPETAASTLEQYPLAATILVFPSNIAPTANAGPAQSVAPLSTVTLDGTGSTDPEAGALTYSWSQTAGPAVALSSASASKPTFTAPADVNDVPLTFSLTVTDNLGQASSPSAVVVTVSAGPYLLRRQAGVWVRRKLLRRTGGAWVWP